MTKKSIINFLLFLSVFNIFQTQNLQSQTFDVDVLKKIHTNRNISLDNPMQIISNSIFVAVPAIPLGLFSAGLIENDKEMLGKSIQIGASSAISALTSLGIKQLIQRDRPFVEHSFFENIGKETGYSMPSVHTTFAFSTATSLSLQFPKWYVIVPSYLWATLVGYSRMHLGVHYLSDVIVGALIGAGVGILTYHIEKNIYNKHFK
jgi:membrane-associated phospholipid phosphatase